MGSFSLFAEGNFQAALEELEKNRDQNKHNLEVVKYYRQGCKDPQELLDRMISLDCPSAVSIYNKSVLSFYLEHYGAVLQYLTPLCSSLDCIDDYISIKISFLRIETYLAMELKEEANAALETLEKSGIYSSVLKLNPEKGIFHPLIIGSWVDDKSSDELSEGEYWFATNVLRCRYHLLLSEAEPAKKALNEAEQNWVTKVKSENYDPEMFAMLASQYFAIKNYLNAEIAYTEGNMNSTLQHLNRAQLEILPVLGDRQSHPSCQPSKEKLSHPIFHYNNLGCIHLRLGKPKLARFYFSKACGTLRNQTLIDSSKPLATITHYASQRRGELLYNSALSFINSHKPKQALDCLHEIASIMQGKPLFWYRAAECYVMLSLQGLEIGRREMLSDICMSQNDKKYVLPSKVTYIFKDEDEKVQEGPLEKAIKCLRNALTLCKDEELKVHILLLLCYSAMNSQPQCALSSAQQLLHMDITDPQRFIATMYASEALLILGKPRQAIEYLSHIPKELKIKCHSTLSPNSAVFTEDQNSRYIQSINLTCAHLHSGNIPLAQQALNSALNLLNITFQPQTQPSQPVPAPILSLAIYISLKLGNHAQAEQLIKTRHIFSGMTYSKATPDNSTFL
ncbi:unnamed protein product [Blepharisma stoltei]|uniref:CCR4-NOT transcription complex subunit 10 n=1 Tax=Blepharisma stoltei TaxID=1481888 RepID=A0AAU9IQD5_9CILI|nr:unnamed protein product [Blepharisma stoltei]